MAACRGTNPAILGLVNHSQGGRLLAVSCNTAPGSWRLRLVSVAGLTMTRVPPTYGRPASGSGNCKLE